MLESPRDGRSIDDNIVEDAAVSENAPDKQEEGDDGVEIENKDEAGKESEGEPLGDVASPVPEAKSPEPSTSGEPRADVKGSSGLSGSKAANFDIVHLTLTTIDDRTVDAMIDRLPTTITSAKRKK